MQGLVLNNVEYLTRIKLWGTDSALSGMGSVPTCPFREPLTQWLAKRTRGLCQASSYRGLQEPSERPRQKSNLYAILSTLDWALTGAGHLSEPALGCHWHPRIPRLVEPPTSHP